MTDTHILVSYRNVPDHYAFGGFELRGSTIGTEADLTVVWDKIREDEENEYAYPGDFEVSYALYSLPEADPETNLPIAPEGHWWRIDNNYVHLVTEKDRTERIRRWFGWREVTRKVVGPVASARIASLDIHQVKPAVFAFKAHLDHRAKVDEIQRRKLAERSKLNGDYPPKKFEH